MDAPAAIDATFVKIEQVASRKVARLHLEIPIERANDALAVLGGFPDPANPAWVGVARLNPPSQKWRPETIHPAKDAALVCQKPTFWAFLRDAKHARCEGEEDAATYVRRLCNVNTRADFATNGGALAQWRDLHAEYETWMAAGGAA